MIALLYDVQTETIKELPPYAFGRRWWKTVEWPHVSLLVRDDPTPREIHGWETAHCEYHVQDDVSVYVKDQCPGLRLDATWKALEWLVLR